jgi:hypothetical protein
MERILANVARVDIITEETTPQLITGTTGTEAGIEPYVSEGTEEILRSKNRVLAQNNYEDIVLGYNINLKDVQFDPEQFAVFDGGTYTADGDGYTYDGPEMGTAVSRKRVTLDIWTEEKDVDGEVLHYHRFRFRHTRGTPVKFTHKDGGFYAPEYALKSRAKKNEKPINIKQFDALPASDATAATLLAS